jgi:hypothetical protein
LPGGAPVPEHLRPEGSLPGDGVPSPVIYPPQSLGVRFNHRLHVRLGATCTTCHERAKTSRRSADSLLPKGTRCDGCHGSNHRATPVIAGGELLGQCGYCHVGYREGDGNRVARVAISPPNLKFDHAVHAEKGISCEKCHGKVAELELATVDQLPRMRGCLDCHEHENARAGEPSGACPTCHLTERGGHARDALRDGLAVAAAMAQELGARARLHRAAQARRGRRQPLLRDVPRGAIL